MLRPECNPTPPTSVTARTLRDFYKNSGVQVTSGERKGAAGGRPFRDVESNLAMGNSHEKRTVQRESRGEMVKSSLPHGQFREGYCTVVNTRTIYRMINASFNNGIHG